MRVTAVNRKDRSGHVDECQGCVLVFDVYITVSLLICMEYRWNCCDSNRYLLFVYSE
jgi:hypothetical protein